MAFNKPNARLVADILEHRCISLLDALNELGMDPALNDDAEFCCELDQHILFCTECFYWFLPCMITDSPVNQEDVCEECAAISKD